ncbi:HAMP domain-containing protein [Candidatus Electrothrix sp.]|uniref:HAMP domain-containing protein n=1 Tax=Candidatus Electrothrix sp. TaxID=2170559 RepID=UPI004055B8A1
MLVICEDCAKKYSIDEKRIKAPKVKFNCRACNHLIIVEKPKNIKKPRPEADIFSALSGQDTPDNSPKEQTSRQQQKEQAASKSAAESSSTVRAALKHSAAASGKGSPFYVYLISVMLFILLITTAFFVHIYLKTIPDVLQHQLELRSQILTESLQQIIRRPLSRKDYLRVNRMIKRASKLPGVAYTAVTNKKGIVIAGFFNNLNKFENQFAQRIKEEGFQLDILIENSISLNEKWAGAKVQIGGVPVYNQVTSFPGTGDKLHIGLYVDEIDKNFFKALFSPFTVVLLALFILSIYTIFALLDKLVTEPTRTLTNTANRISLGELNLAIMAAGPREIRELGSALERMRHSIKVAMEQRLS